MKNEGQSYTATEMQKDLKETNTLFNWDYTLAFFCFLFFFNTVLRLCTDLDDSICIWKKIKLKG